MQAPPGLDFDLDVHDIKRQAEAQVVRSREHSESSVNFTAAPPATGAGSGGGAFGNRKTSTNLPLQSGTPIHRKRAPLSARGRMQDSSTTHEAALLQPPARARVRPSSAHGPSHAYEPEVPEEEVEEEVATGDMDENTTRQEMANVSNHVPTEEEMERGGGHDMSSGGENVTYGGGNAGRQCSRTSEYADLDDLVDVRKQRSNKDVLRPATMGKQFKTQRSSKGAGSSNRAKTAWPPNGAGMPPRSWTGESIQGSFKTTDAAYRPTKKVLPSLLSFSLFLQPLGYAVELLNISALTRLERVHGAECSADGNLLAAEQEEGGYASSCGSLATCGNASSRRVASAAE